MLKSVLLMTLFALFTLSSLSKAYYSRRCWEDHSKVSMKTHAQKFVEDLSTPRAQRAKAMICLSFYGKTGVPILRRNGGTISDVFSKTDLLMYNNTLRITE